MNTPAGTPAGASMTEERFLLARVGREHFAFPLAEVLEVVEAPEVTPVPLAPVGVAGQCVHRDRLVPVLDGATLLGTRRDEGRGVLLLLQTDDGIRALRMDDVLDMVTVGPAQRRAVPATVLAASGTVDALLDLGGRLAACVAMDALRGAMRARLAPEAA